MPQKSKSNIREGLTRVNARSVINKKAVRYETRNGREVVIVPSATLPDNVVMNGIRYPAEEIEKGYKTLERTPAPFGHPLVNGSWVSALDPEGLNLGWIGAHNENVRRENGRVYLDKVIDIEVANRTEGGKEVLAALAEGEPVHTSTGIYINLVATTNDSEAEFYATNMVFDHDAILIGQEGAATPDQGVGMMVNHAAPGIQVVNSRVEWAEEDLEWAVDHVVDSFERLEDAKKRESIRSRLVTVLRDMLLGNPETTSANSTVQTEEEPMDKETQERFEAIETQLGQLGQQVTNSISEALKPLLDAQEASLKANESRERKELTDRIVKAALLDEEGCEIMPVANLRKLADKINNNRRAAPVTNGADNDGNTGRSSYRLPKAEG